MDITDLVDTALVADRPTGAIELPDHPITDTAPATEVLKAKPTTSWRDRIKVHPAADEFPMMAEEELKALGEDIRANGLKMPIVFYNDGRGGGGVSLLDGRNRLAAMELAGYHLDLSYSALRDPGRTLRAEGPDGKPLLVHIQHVNKDPRGFTISANLRRRHLGAEERQKWAVELKSEGQSNVRIAELLGVSEGTVRNDLKATSQNYEVERVVGKDGKSRPARMTRKPKAAPAVEEPRAPEQPKVVTTDDLRTWIDLKPALPMSELFMALWDCMSGGERLTVHELVASDEWRSSRPRVIDRQPQQNRA